MKVLFIGGTGEISHSCVTRAEAVGHDVTVFNRGQTDAALPSGIRQLHGQFEDDARYGTLADETFDVVCQFLAFEMEDIQRDIRVFGGRCRQYIFISTASAYRKPPRDHVVTEDTPLHNPFWPYSQKKADMEAYLLEQHHAGHINATIVRPSHTVRTKFPGGIVRGDDWAWRLLQGKAILVHGDGTALWTLTHSSDFAVPFERLLGNQAAFGEAFHITRPMKAYTWNEIFSEMASALNADANLVHVPADTLVRYNHEWIGPLFGDKIHSVLFDNAKVMQVAGDFECEIGLAEIMRRSAEHFQLRAAIYQPNMAVHDLLDRIAADIAKLGEAT